jgi:hypothetical protein
LNNASGTPAWGWINSIRFRQNHVFQILPADIRYGSFFCLLLWIPPKKYRANNMGSIRKVTGAKLTVTHSIKAREVVKQNYKPKSIAPQRLSEHLWWSPYRSIRFANGPKCDHGSFHWIPVNQNPFKHSKCCLPVYLNKVYMKSKTGDSASMKLRLQFD